MNFEDEKDYIMRLIKEMAGVVFSLIYGKQYVAVEQAPENPYETAGKKLSELLAMADGGNINEAENILRDGMNYADKNEVAEAVLFYQYLSEKEEDFLLQNDYSREEILDGLKYIMQKSGYGGVVEAVEGE